MLLTFLVVDVVAVFVVVWRGILFLAASVVGVFRCFRVVFVLLLLLLPSAVFGIGVDLGVGVGVVDVSDDDDVVGGGGVLAVAAVDFVT